MGTNQSKFGLVNALNPADSLVDGTKVVATGGTAEALATSTKVRWVIVQALTGNGGNIFAGGSTIADGRGIALTATSALTLTVRDLAEVWLDTDNDGDGVSYVAGI